MLLLVPFALALEIRLDAEVAPDLRRVSGVMRLSGGAPPLLDPLARFPPPADDRTLLRTFPGAPDTGEVRWEPLPGEPGAWRFEARLPRRHGAVGTRPRRGLWADGGWYPQPHGDDGAPVADWDVRVRLPEGVTGALNGVTGDGELRWTGRADRAALAALRGGRVVEAAVAGGTVRFLERGPGERRVHREVTRLVAEGWPYAEPPGLVVVETPDHLRLAQAAPAQVYLADGAFRVTPGVERFHRGAVRRALYAAAAPFDDGWSRAYAATVLAAGTREASPRRALGWLAWNPIVDALLTDGTLPYYTDLFHEAFPEHPGLVDGLSPRVPARAAALQAMDRDGADAVRDAVLAALAEPATASDFAAVAGADVRAQDYRIERGAVVRDAPADAPVEAVVVEVDGERRVWLAGPGPDRFALPEGARRVAVDPERHVRQADRAGDAWPSPWTVTASGWVEDISASQGTFSVWGDLAFRRRDDTRNLFLAGLAHDAQDLVSAELGYVRWLGPLVDRRRRVHRLVAVLGPSLLDPAFRPTDRGAVALDAAVSYAWDTRDQDTWAISGHRFSLGASAGWIPGATDRWATAGVSEVVLLPLHPRHVLALRGKAGWATGPVEHRLLPLGGADSVRAVPEGAVVGEERLVATAEYRWTPLRNAAVPLGLAWLSEVQLVPGLEGGVAWRGSTRWAAAGATLGLYTVFDLLGARPTLGGVSVAAPLATEGFAAAGLQVYVEFDHAF